MRGLSPHLTLLAVGRAKNGPEKDLYDHYAARLPMGLSLCEVEEKRTSSPAQRKEREGILLLSALPPRGPVVVLDERGKTLTSAAFAERMGQWHDEGNKNVSFLIGGADGHTDTIRQRADLLLSFGSMTWPHMLVRALLAEQLWRAHSILIGHPYHREG